MDQLPTAQSRIDTEGNGSSMTAYKEWERFGSVTVGTGTGSQGMKKNCQVSLEDLVDASQYFKIKALQKKLTKHCKSKIIF